MDTLSFIAALVDALAWPLVVAAIILGLRRPLTELIPLLERFKVKGVEVEFSKKVREVADEAQAAVPTPPAATFLEPDQDLIELADYSPRAAIIESWVKLERAATEAAKKRGLKLGSADLRSPIRLVQSLQEAHVIDQKQASLLTDLRGIRNAAAHASDLSLTSSTAAQYAAAAGRLAGALRQSSTG